jgi:hypothetical protein
MNKIALEATEFTPLVIFDHVDFRFEIKGESTPEDARLFYGPLIKWIEDFGNYLHFLHLSTPSMKKKKMDFRVHLEYVSSSSLKNLFDLLLKIETLKPYSESIKIIWVADAGDEDMEENGLEFSKMVKIPFELMSE